MYDEDLYALRKQDPSVATILTKLPKVSCFARKDSDDPGRQFSGRFILYDRQSYPSYGFCITNELTYEDEYGRYIFPEDDITVNDRDMTIRFSPLGPSSIPDIHVTDMVELTGLAKDTMVLIIWLHSRSTSQQHHNNWGLTSANTTPLHLTLQLSSILSPASPPPDSTSLSGSPESPVVNTYPFFTSRPGSPGSPLSASSTSSSFSQQHHAQSMSMNNFPSSSSSTTDIPRLSMKTPFFKASAPKNYAAHRALLHKLFPKASQVHVHANGNQYPAVTPPPPSIPPASAVPPLPLPVPVPVPAPAPVISLTESLKVVTEAAHSHSNPGSPKPNYNCPDLSGKTTRIRERPAGTGQYSTVYQGVVLNGEKSELVAIKVLRAPTDDNLVPRITTQKLAEVTAIWHSLQHPNILPFLGTSDGFSSPGSLPALITFYCLHRDLVHHLKQNRDTDRSAILMGITRGLEYLHARNVVHGRLCGKNILIDSRNRPRISDAAFYKLLPSSSSSLDSTPSTSSARQYQYTAPELLPSSCSEPSSPIDPSESFHAAMSTMTPTFASDIYAYGLLALLTATSIEPFLPSSSPPSSNSPSLPPSTFNSKPPDPIALTRESWQPIDCQDYELAAGVLLREELCRVVYVCCEEDPLVRPAIGKVGRYLRAVEGDLCYAPSPGAVGGGGNVVGGTEGEA